MIKVASSKNKSYRHGHLAEYFAALFLFFKGYRILKRRYKTPVGEIDLIARRGKKLVFVEVKSRAHVEDGLYAITSQNKNRVSRAAQYFIMQDDADTYKNGDSHGLRFDVIIQSSWRLRHIPNAWSVSTDMV